MNYFCGINKMKEGNDFEKKSILRLLNVLMLLKQMNTLKLKYQPEFLILWKMGTLSSGLSCSWGYLLSKS